MDTNNKPDKKETNFETGKWKSVDFRTKVVKKISDTLIEQRGFPPEANLSDVTKSIERFEAMVNASAKTEMDYIAMIQAKVREICVPSQNAESKVLPQNPSGPETTENQDLQEHTYRKVQHLKSKYFHMLSAHFQRLCSILQGRESSTQESRTVDMGKLRRNKKILECIFKLFELNKSQITPDYKERVDQAERVIDYIQNNVSPQGKPSADVKPKHQAESSCSRISAKENQGALPFIKSQQDINQLLSIKDTGNIVKQQTHHPHATQASDVNINASGILASPLVKESNNQHEISHKPSFTSSEGLSPAMQRLITAFTTVSREALRAAITEIRDVVYMCDALPISAYIDDLPYMMEQKETQPNIIPKGAKTRRSFDAIPYDIPIIDASACDGFSKLTDGEKLNMNSFKRPRIEVSHNLLEEVKEINKFLIDCEVVINEKGDIKSQAGVAADQNEGLVVNILFNAHTINQELLSHITTDKKTLIKPLWLLVPTSYPLSSPVILDNMPLEASTKDPLKFSMRAKEKLRSYLQSMDQPWSLKIMAESWERFARETILKYAHEHGGGAFSSIYGGWENADLD